MEVSNERNNFNFESTIIKEEYTIQEEDFSPWQEQTCSSESRSTETRTENSVRCCFCPESFSNRNELKTHYQTHCDEMNELRYKYCRICNRQFSSVTSYKRHLRNHRKVTSNLAKQQKQPKCYFPCEICGKIFPHLKRLMGHLKAHFSKYIPLDRPFSCTLCKTTFTSLTKITAHLKNRHKKVLKREQVKQRTTQSNIIEKYIKNSSGVPCLYCDNTLKDECDLGIHLRCFHRGLPEHKNDAPVSPSICSVLIERIYPTQSKEEILQKNLKRSRMICGTSDFTLGPNENSTKKRQSSISNPVKSSNVKVETIPGYELDEGEGTWWQKTDPLDNKQTKDDAFTCPICKQKFGEQKLAIDHVIFEHTGNVPRFMNKPPNSNKEEAFKITQNSEASMTNSPFIISDDDSSILSITEESLTTEQDEPVQYINATDDPSLIIIEDSNEGYPMEIERITMSDDMTIYDDIKIEEEEITIQDEEVKIVDDVLQENVQNNRVILMSNDLQAIGFKEDGELISCRFCIRDFECGFQLKVHNSVAHCSTAPCMCTICKNTFETCDDLIEHSIDHLRIGDTQSVETPKITQVHDNATNSSMQHEKVTCHNCGITLWSGFELRKHVKKFCAFATSSSERFKCECGLTFQKYYDIRMHISPYVLTVRRKPYICTICNKNFSRHGDVLNHIFQHNHIHNVLTLAPLESEFVKRWITELPVDVRENSKHTCKLRDCVYNGRSLQSLREETDLEIVKKGLPITSYNTDSCPLQPLSQKNWKVAMEAYKSAIFFDDMEQAIDQL